MTVSFLNAKIIRHDKRMPRHTKNVTGEVKEELKESNKYVLYKSSFSLFCHSVKKCQSSKLEFEKFVLMELEVIGSLIVFVI